MGLFKRENRAAEVTFEDGLLRALLGGDMVTKQMALQVPTVAGGIDLIANIIASTPIKLYRDAGGEAEEVRDDARVRLLNDETGDTLSANDFWRAIVRDYYLGKGGYAYINKERGSFKSLHYVDEAQISIQRNFDPIFKDFNICVQGMSYKPFEFLKILRNTRDGMEGTPITVESSKLIEVAYQALCFELYLVKKGGNKKGFLKSKKKIDDVSMKNLREAYTRLYSNSSDNVVVLNDGIEFQESSNTSVEMQLNENKVTNSEEFAKIFHVSVEAMGGKTADTSGLAKLAAVPLMTAIQCALNKDLLLEKEKRDHYWAFDTKELLKGDIRERYEAYKMALEANFMQVDEVRYQEDLEPLGLTWIKLGLNDVLYDPKSGTIYTPNTNKTSRMGEEALPEAVDDGKIEDEPEERARQWIKGEKGLFAGSVSSGGGGGKGGSGKTKYAPSPQRNRDGVQLKPKEYARVCGLMNTRYFGLEAGERRIICDAKYQYDVTADGNGGMSVNSKTSISRGRKQ